ncbi:MAG: L-fucose:H+ symporter permease, partial [Eggerthellaceae bacterium]|nr:L-fucose:H+ symporter permease [Eggerthellaceae bacterium]
YASGCFLFIPAGLNINFSLFLFSYLILTCGLSFLETSANPFILSLGDSKSATRRLNIAQAFNPCGAILGMLTASQIILVNLDSTTEAERAVLRDVNPASFSAMQQLDIATIIVPYICLGAFILVVLLIFFFVRMPEVSTGADTSKILDSVKRLFRTPRYFFGIIAQFFYNGLQICCWTFIIQYAGHELGIDKATAELWNILAMVCFVTFRFICTWLMKYISPGRLLGIFAICGFFTVVGAIFFPGYAGLYSLIATSAFMSLMFPTIYGLSLDDHGEDAKLGSAGLIFAIGGGAVFPPIMGGIMDGPGIAVLDSTRLAFFVPLVCLVVICAYGFACFRGKKKRLAEQENVA